MRRARCVVGFVCIAPAVAAAQVCEGPRFLDQLYPQPGIFYASELADLDGDGDLDLVVGTSAEPSLAIWLNRGDGVFDPAGQYNDIPHSIDISVGDVDRDGDIDVVAVTDYDRKIHVLVNDGDAVFELSDRFEVVGSHEMTIDLGELDGDGLPDIVFHGGGRLHLLRNLGEGAFERPGDGESTGHIQTIDINADGFVDVMVQQSGVTKLRINDGTGGFADVELFDTHGDTSTRHAVLDANTDGLLDVVRVTLAPMAPGSYVLLQQPDGTFGEPVYSDVGFASLGPIMTLIDIDVDGFDDIVSSRGGASGWGVMRSLGDGRFEFGGSFESWIGSIFSFASGDVDADGWTDLVISGRNVASVRLHNGVDGFDRSPVSSIAGRGGLAAGDFNGDGFTDVAGVDYLDDALQVVFGRGDGTLTEPVTYAVGSEPDDVLAIDLNDDGALDLVVSNQWSRDLSGFLGDGSGGFEEQPRVDLGERPRGLTAADLDGDGRQEILVAMHIADSVDVFGVEADGALAFERRIPVQRRPFDLEATDFDRDGDMDLVVLDDLYDEVHVFTRDASGAYVEASSVPLDAIEPRTLKVGDLNQDGFPDAVALSRSKFMVLMNDGVGGLGVSRVEFLFSRASDLKLGDMDGDGDLDILVDSPYPQIFWNEQGTFESSSAYVARSGVHSFAIDDFNGDGSLDIFTANWDDFATVLLNQQPCQVTCPADVDRDGQLTVFDFLAFQDLFEDGDLRADFDGDGEFTIFDFLVFQNAFDAGCE